MARWILTSREDIPARILYAPNYELAFRVAVEYLMDEEKSDWPDSSEHALVLSALDKLENRDFVIHLLDENPLNGPRTTPVFPWRMFGPKVLNAVQELSSTWARWWKLDEEQPEVAGEDLDQLNQIVGNLVSEFGHDTVRYEVG